MEKRYQFFISSTFTDLKDERQSVLKAVLELGHLPAGMELFPASDESAWQLIRDVIDASDHYLVIVGGRYGSTDEEGLSYTEKEYDYAFQRGKPVLAFLHASPDELPRQSTDTVDAAWQKLQMFRDKLKKNHTVVMWTSAEGLKAKVIVSATKEMKRHPGVGWVRADQVLSTKTLADMLALKDRVAELEEQLHDASLTPPQGTEDFQQGDDRVVINTEFDISEDEMSFFKSTHPVTMSLTWNAIFAGVAPTMINEASEASLVAAFRRFFKERGRAEIAPEESGHVREFRCGTDQIETCIVQFRALGLIRESIRKRGVRDTNTYWTLTPWGDHLMTTLRAISKSKP